MAANARERRSRSASLACTSPAAAMRMVVAHPAGYPLARFCERRKRVHPRRHAIGPSREPPLAARDDEARGRRRCARTASTTCSVEASRSGRAEGPPTDHDVDFLLREEDADRALEVLDGRRLPTGAPAGALAVQGVGRREPRGPRLPPRGGPIGDEHFARATELEVSAHRTLVASIDDVLVAKLLAINEQEPDFRAVLEISRRCPRAGELEERRAQDEALALRARVLRARRGPRDRGRQHLASA